MIILLNSLKHIKKDFELSIFNDFDPEIYLEDDVLSDPRITFYGRTPRKTMYKYIEKSHIHAYPPIFLETFCIAIAESMSAGLLPVYANIGAVPEVAGKNGLFLENIPMSNEIFDGDLYAEEYAKLLEKAMDMIIENRWDPSEQISRINELYNWNTVIKKWQEFHELI